jgi:ribosomal protein L37AE/L43A
MTLHAELPGIAMQAQFYQTNSCAHCGRKLLAPESIEHVSDRIVRYLWLCEMCGHQFETSVYLAPAWHCYA